jgi:hypothetical protein
MLRFRWVLLVLCGLLCIVLAVPVRSADNLVENCDFSSPDASSDVFPGWVRNAGSAVRDITVFHSAAPSMTPEGSIAISYSQCVDTTGLAGVDVGGWVRFSPVDIGNIVVELYPTSGCEGAEASGGTTLVLTDENVLWAKLQQTYTLPPDEAHTFVKITLNADSSGAYFDDIFLYEHDPTGVLLVEPAMQAAEPVALVPILAIALVVLGLARVLGRRKP